MVGDINKLKKVGGKIEYSHQKQRARFPKKLYLSERRDRKMNFKSRYTKVTNLATLQTGKKRKREE